MTATLQTQHRARCTLGGDVIEAVTSDAQTLASDAKHDVQLTLADNAADGTVTLWDASTSQVDEPTYLAVIVDPQKILSTVQPIAMELTVDAQVVVLTINRLHPFVLTSPDGDATDITSLSGKVTLVRVRNNNADGQGDVPVRCIAMK